MTSTLPDYLAWPMLVTLAVIVILRVLFLHTLVDKRLSTMLAFWVFVGLLRDPHVQNLLAVHLVDPSVIRQATHMCAMLASAAMIGAVTIWAAPDHDNDGFITKTRRRDRQPLIYCAVFLAGLALFPLSAPARVAGQTLEEHGTWHVVAYMTIYSAPTIVAVTCLAALAWETARAAGTRVLQIGAGLAVFISAVSAFDGITRIINSFLVAAHQNNAFTEWRSESNDILFLPEVTAIAIVLATPLAHRLAAKLGIDGASRRIRRLEPMWRDLTEAMPTVVLHPRPTDVDAIVDRLEIEIWDTIVRLRPYLRPDLTPHDLPDLAQVSRHSRADVIRALAVHEAIDTYRAQQGTRPIARLDDHTESIDIDRLARAWATARDLKISTNDPANQEGHGQPRLSRSHG
ncbi:MAB_1171c family putative transporter [Rhodococcus zopfii]|uniref:MAB_1171c family putative transporter n=1 Tax=Rhodococcus zopfii TaxID=43772 RepID=UPI0009336860|nr:MAB_1171c family putative transporter [Rhodococcus zopfii]